MADITNPEAIRFANERIRPMADALAQAYYSAKLFIDEWDANSMNTLITNTNQDTFIDGSAVDGRHPVTGADARRIYDVASALVLDFEATINTTAKAKLKYALEVAVNPQR